MTGLEKFTALNYTHKTVETSLGDVIVVSDVITILDTPVGKEIHFIKGTVGRTLVAIYPINKPDTIGFISLNSDEVDAIHTLIGDIDNG